MKDDKRFACPAIPQLVSVLGQSRGPGVWTHIRGCASCQKKIAQLWHETCPTVDEVRQWAASGDDSNLNLAMKQHVVDERCPRCRSVVLSLDWIERSPAPATKPRWRVAAVTAAAAIVLFGLGFSIMHLLSNKPSGRLAAPSAASEVPDRTGSTNDARVEPKRTNDVAPQTPAVPGNSAHFPVSTPAAASQPLRSLPSTPVDHLPATGVRIPVSESAISAATNQNKRIAIAPFKFSAPMNELQAAFGTSEKIGDGLKAVLTEQLVKGGKLTVVDSDLEFLSQAVASENSTGKPAPGPQMGQLSGADLVLVGDIVTFGRGPRTGSRIIGRGFVGDAGGASGSNKAVVIVSYRIIDAATREVILSGQARGESKREDKNMFGSLVAPGAAEGTRVDMTSSSFAETILGEAALTCVQNLAIMMIEKASTLPPRSSSSLQARVAAVSGSQVTINVGTNAGVQIGDVFEISKVLREIKDPVSGEVLDIQLELVGQLTIVDADPRVSTGNYVGAPVANSYVAQKKKPF